MLLVCIVFLATASYTGAQVNDNRATNIAALRIVTDGSLALPPEWAEDIRWVEEGADGRAYVDRFPGTIAHGVPFHLVASWFGVNEDPSHPAFVNYAPGGVAAATIAAAFIAVLYLVFRQLVDRPLAVAGALIAAFGTATWSVTADALWTHGPTSLWLTVGMLFLAKGQLARSGLGFAVAVLARPQTAVAPAVVGIWRGIKRRDLRPVLVIGATSALGALGLSLYSKAIFGTWMPVAGYPAARATQVVTNSGSGDSSLSFPVEVWHLLVNDERGVLLFTPFLVVLLLFLHRGWRVAPEWVKSSAIAGIVYMVVQLRANAWDGGSHFYGSRLTIEMLVLSAPLLILTVQEGVRQYSLRWLLLQVVVVVSIVVHGIGATTQSLSPEGRGQWPRYIRLVCLDHPELPECAEEASNGEQPSREDPGGSE